MLDQETKRRIDTLRNILVGKVPDPKSQVEQITISLIYKFMNDMDEESMSMGGVPSFFVNEFEKYSWKNIFNARLNGAELVSLYSESVMRMSLNPHIPQLFRNIFKNAYIPYRDPETLRLFLKTINEFEYTHSEKLGDAFEYLLSFMGSQGDAGQFRTPRHIIDFVVEIVNPKKTDTILDPASGTAGFLISAYKHILKSNSEKLHGDLLSSADRISLSKNINGYDISPDMVRLGLVNLYLHNFTDPRIFEYDSLTSEDRWGEYYDIILANPPFMTPKGGIRPHHKFGVKSNRAEVLFVDYIMEHLKPSGRAGIVIPEGIIFDGDKSYRELRKLLIEQALVAVISLPAGVFKPYSGVKTSILILDKNLSKRTKNILFFKVDNDGFDLGAQRNPIDQNDLPEVSRICREYFEAKDPDSFNGGVLVEKEAILNSDDISLSFQKYKISEIKESIYPMVNINDYVDFQRGQTITQKQTIPGDIPVIAGGQQPAYFHNQPNRSGKTITISSSGAYSGFVNYFEIDIFASDCFTAKSNSEELDQKFLYYLLKSKQDYIYTFQNGGGQPHVYAKDFKNFQIPLPPVEDQLKIVNEIDGYNEIIQSCKKIKARYKPSFRFDPNWTYLNLGEIATFEYGLGESASNEGEYRFIRISDINEFGLLDDSDQKFIDISTDDQKYILNHGDVLMARTGATYGKCLYFDADVKSVYAGYLIKINFSKETLLNKFFWIYAQSEDFDTQKKKLVTGGGQPQFNANTIANLRIPVPPIEEQLKIIDDVMKEQESIVSVMNLTKIYSEKIANRMQGVWSK